MSLFRAVFADPKWTEDLHVFLKNIFHLYPEDEFHQLLREQTEKYGDDELIYKHSLEEIGRIKPFMSELTYALPALRLQKEEMARQTLEVLPSGKTVYRGHVEIGSTGRYVSELRDHITIEDPIYLLHDVAPSYAPPDIVERGQIRKLGEFIPLEGYRPIPATEIPDESVDMVTCYIGFHHILPERVDGFLESVHRVLRPGGVFVFRDHDVGSPEMHTFVSVVHTVFNIGLKETWEFEAADTKSTRSAEEWATAICSAGFTDTGKRLLQEGDPSRNTLMSFLKT